MTDLKARAGKAVVPNAASSAPMPRLQPLQARLDKDFPLLQIIENKGAGNCQFYAVADQLVYHNPNVPLKHDDLRKQTAVWLKDHADTPVVWTPLFSFSHNVPLQPSIGNTPLRAIKLDPEPDWAAFANKMAKDGTWGELVTLIAMAEITHQRIVVIANDPKYDVAIVPSTYNPAQPTPALIIGYLFEWHYVSLRGVSDAQPKEDEDKTKAKDKEDKANTDKKRVGTSGTRKPADGTRKPTPAGQ